MRDGGKGDKPRPIPDRKKFEDNWDAIFKKKPEELKAQFKTQTYGFDTEKGGFFVEDAE